MTLVRNAFGDVHLKVCVRQTSGFDCVVFQNDEIEINNPDPAIAIIDAINVNTNLQDIDGVSLDTNTSIRQNYKRS